MFEVELSKTKLLYFPCISLVFCLFCFLKESFFQSRFDIFVDHNICTDQIYLEGKIFKKVALFKDINHIQDDES